MKLMVLDGNSILNRAYYGIRPLSTREGLYTHAVYGFITTLQRLLDEENPEALCVTFDRREPTFRHRADAEYKAQRKPMPPELAMQLPVMKQVLSAMSVPCYELAGYEADDLIDELIDRFGDLPSGVSALINVALLRGEAGKAGISDISQKSGKLIFALRDFDMERISALYARPEYKGVLKVEAGTAPRVSLRLRSNARIVDQARKFIKDFSEAF